MDPNTKIGGPDAPYRNKQRVEVLPKLAAQAPMRLARMLRLYIAADLALTQRTVAQETGISDSTLSRFLAGEQMPDARAFAALLTWCLGDHAA